MIDPFRVCEEITRQAGKNFAAGYLHLDRETRRAMNALYAFARLSDDIADDPLPAGLVSDAPAERARQFAAWRTGLDRAWRDPRAEGHHPVLAAIAEVGRTHILSRDLLEEIVAGCEDDLVVARYRTYDDLRGYVAKVAVAVGLLMLEVFRARTAERENPMRALGEAFQLTNILRDVREDLARDRIYLPLATLARHGASEEDVAAAVAGARPAPGLVACVAEHVQTARDRYRTSDVLFAGPHALPRGPRRTVLVMRLLYEGILDRIAENPGGVFRERPGLSPLSKAAALLRGAA